LARASHEKAAPGRPRKPGQAPGGPASAGRRLADFLFEASALKRTPRTGYQFLGRGHENVAEHSFGTAAVAFALGRLAGGEADLGRLVAMALFHDLAEARTGDLNYVNKRYVAADETKAFEDAVGGLPFEGELRSLWEEWARGDTLEARLAKDADQIDLILELKRLASHGWSQASDWLFYAMKRLATGPGRQLAEAILDRDPDGWWFERRDELWVNPRPLEAPAAAGPTGAGGRGGPKRAIKSPAEKALKRPGKSPAGASGKKPSRPSPKSAPN
jgi:putative hydrolase of HD superfamily